MPFWKSPAFLIIGSQLLFSASDLIGKWAMKNQGFKLASFCTGWFLLYTVVRQIAVFGQLYIYSSIELGRALALFGAGSIIIGNVFSFLLFREAMSLPTYVGVSLAICAFLALALLPEGTKKAPAPGVVDPGGMPFPAEMTSDPKATAPPASEAAPTAPDPRGAEPDRP